MLWCLFNDLQLQFVFPVILLLPFDLEIQIINLQRTIYAIGRLVYEKKPINPQRRALNNG